MSLWALSGGSPKRQLFLTPQSRLHSSFRDCTVFSYRSAAPILLERYFNGRRATTPANVKSVSKSVIAALVGIASDRKLLSLNDPIGKYFPDLAEAGKRAITVEDLLTMRSGLESTSSRNYGAWVQSSNWIRHALAKPLLAAPGTQMIYSTGNSHLLSAILTKATGKSTLAVRAGGAREAAGLLSVAMDARSAGQSTSAATRW